MTPKKEKVVPTAPVEEVVKSGVKLNNANGNGVQPGVELNNANVNDTLERNQINKTERSFGRKRPIQ